MIGKNIKFRKSTLEFLLILHVRGFLSNKNSIEIKLVFGFDSIDIVPMTDDEKQFIAVYFVFGFLNVLKLSIKTQFFNVITLSSVK